MLNIYTVPANYQYPSREYIALRTKCRMGTQCSSSRSRCLARINIIEGICFYNYYCQCIALVICEDRCSRMHGFESTLSCDCSVSVSKEKVAVNYVAYVWDLRLRISSSFSLRSSSGGRGSVWLEKTVRPKLPDSTRAPEFWRVPEVIEMRGC